MREVFAYGRVSTEGQNLQIQVDKFKLIGIEERNIFLDKDSGAKNDRKELQKLLSKLRPGDKVVFYDLTRLGRDVKYLITLIDHFNDLKVDFQDLTTPAINTEEVKTAHGELIFLIFAVIAQFMRKSSNDKVRAGLEAARAQGKYGGRPKGLSKRLKEKAPLVAIMYKDPSTSISQIAKTMGMAPASIYKCLKHEGINIGLSHKNKGNKNRTMNTKIE